MATNRSPGPFNAQIRALKHSKRFDVSVEDRSIGEGNFIYNV